MATTEKHQHADHHPHNHPAPNQNGQLSGRPDPTKPGFFPLGYKEAAYQWWNFVDARRAEGSVLKLVEPGLRAFSDAVSTPDGATTDSTSGSKPWKTQIFHLPDTLEKFGGAKKVGLKGDEKFGMNEFSINADGKVPYDNTLVMLHGYGAGLGFFYKNFAPLSREEGWRIFALDWLGMGNSSRPPFKIDEKHRECGKRRLKTQDEKVAEAEDWFIDALEEWRQRRNIDKFTLIGHSLGGYLSVAYALKYPGHINKLILASPVGIPENPYAVDPEKPEPQESRLENEFTQDQDSIVAGDNNGFLQPRIHQDAAARDDQSIRSRSSNASETVQPRKLPPWLVWLWNQNVSPFSFVRLSGPLGPRLVSGWSSRRFNHLPEADQHTLHMYSFSIFKQTGSGEYALPYLLAPGAFARSPIINRIAQVGRRPGEKGLPVLMMYGDADWMDKTGGDKAVVRLNDVKDKADRALREAKDAAERTVREVEEQLSRARRAGAGDEVGEVEARLTQAKLAARQAAAEYRDHRDNVTARVVVIPQAGHHLYLDNADDFNRVIRKEMRKTRGKETPGEEPLD